MADALKKANRDVLIFIQAIWQDFDLWEKNYHKALNLLRPFIRQNVQDPVTLTNYGTLLCDMGRHREAESFLRTAVESGSSDRHTVFNLAVALVNLRQENEARRLFARAQKMANHSETWEAYFDPMGH